jgi:DNA-binding NarL/FixJ family response regulator
LKGSLRILLADDHALVRKGLRATIESRAGWSVCGEAATGREAVEMARNLRPDIVVMDLTMPELNGLDATRRILRAAPRTEILILSMHESEQLIHEVLAAGARGYVLKSDAGGAICLAIESLARHKPFFTSRVSEVLLKSYLSPAAGGAPAGETAEALTSREREIVQLIAEGRSSKDVAAALRISVKTAETHRTNLMRKLGVHSVSEIVRYAIRNGIIAP